MNNLPIEDERASKYKTSQNMIDFFKKEMRDGATVYYYGTYEEDGDFGTFSKSSVYCSLLKNRKQALTRTSSRAIILMKIYHEI